MCNDEIVFAARLRCVWYVCTDEGITRPGHLSAWSNTIDRMRARKSAKLLTMQGPIRCADDWVLMINRMRGWPG